MELCKSPPPPPSSHSGYLYSPPPPQLPPDISSIDEVLSVLVKHHQTHSLSPPPEHPPPDTSPTEEVRSVFGNQHKPHSLSLPLTPPLPPLQSPPDISPTDEVFCVLFNQHAPHDLSLPRNPPPPISFDHLNDGDIKKCVISEFSSPADSLIGKFGEISIVNGDQIPEFTDSVTVSKGVVVDDISIIDGDHFPKFTVPKFTGSAVSKGVVDSEEPVHGGEDDSDEPDDEGSDWGDGDDNQAEGVENDQLGGNADPNKANRSDESSPSSPDLTGVDEQYIRFYGIYRRNNPLLLGKIYDYKVEKLHTFQEWEKYVRKCVTKLIIEGLPEHYEVVFEREIQQNEQESKFAYLPRENVLSTQLSRVVLETPEIRYDIYLKDGDVIFRRIVSISKTECAATGSILELTYHLQEMVVKMKFEEYVLNAFYVTFEYAIGDEQNEYPFVEIPKDLTSLLRLLSRIIVEVESTTPHSQPNEASGSGTKRLNEASGSGIKRPNEASPSEASGSGTKRTTTDLYQF